jgi:hypothetical protein
LEIFFEGALSSPEEKQRPKDFEKDEALDIFSGTRRYVFPFFRGSWEAYLEFLKESGASAARIVHTILLS